MNESKPREFWIAQGSHADIVCYNVDQATSFNWQKPVIHVIEHSAYEQAQKEIKALKDENQKLKAALVEARETLEFYANENNWILTTENEFSKVKRTISRDDSESWGYQASPESANIVITIGGKQARAAVENINDALIGKE